MSFNKSAFVVPTGVDATENDWISGGSPTGGAQSGSLYLGDGTFQVSIESMALKGCSTTDPTWELWPIVYVGVDKKTAKSTLLVPTSSHLFGDKAKSYPLQKFLQFCAAVGFENVSTANLPNLVETFYSLAEDFEHTSLAITNGYTRPYLKFEGKGRLVLYRGNGQPMQIGDEIKEFATRQDGQLFALENNIPLQPFPNITKFSAATVPNDLSRLYARNTTKVAAVDDVWF